jgi:DNA-binding PadR family transcriptional regulator
MDEDLKPFLPLSPAALHILLCLSAEVRHGYGIMQEVARQSAQQYELGPGTLYDNLQKLTSQGLVDEAPRPLMADDPRRKYYCLTEFGRRVLEADIVRLRRVVREANLRLREANPGRA